MSLNEFSRAYYLVGRQNTLPLAMFGKMNSGASPTIYALSGSIFLASILAVSFVLLAARRGAGRR
jgi:spermidine/putrescine transport system permease protein